MRGLVGDRPGVALHSSSAFVVGGSARRRGARRSCARARTSARAHHHCRRVARRANARTRGRDVEARMMMTMTMTMVPMRLTTTPRGRGGGARVRQSTTASRRRRLLLLGGRAANEREMTVEEDEETTRRTILGVDASGTPIRDWDECVEWSTRAKPSTETLGLLDASILALALPGVAELLLDPVMGAVDTGFIGRLRGEGAADALGGLAVSTTCFNFCFKLFNFLAVVTGPLVAAKISAAGGRSSAEGRSAAKATVGSAMALAIVLGCASCAVLEVFSDPLLELCGAHHQVFLTADGDFTPPLMDADAPNVDALYENAEAYLRIRAFSLPAALISTVGVGTFRGLLDTKTPLFIACVTEAVHLGLDPLLIFGIGPFVGMNVTGAAIATTAAEWVGALWFVKLMLDEQVLDLRTMFKKPKELDDLGTLVRGSTAQLTRTVFLQTVLVRATATATALGVAGAHQVCLQLWWITLFGLDAVAVSAQALVAASFGKNDVVGARIAADRALGWGVGAGVVVGAVVFLAAPSIPYLFTDDVDIATEAIMPIRILALLQPLNSAVFVGDGVLQGASDFDYLAKAMAIAAGAGILAITVAGNSEGASLASVWEGMAVLMVGRAATLGWRYYRDEASPILPDSSLECVLYYGDTVEDDKDGE